MDPVILAGSAHPSLARAIAERLGVAQGACLLQRFPDGEIQVELQRTVRGQDVYLVQPTSPPVETHLLELLLIADACRRAGGDTVTAVVPYFGYARQDRRAGKRSPVGARLVADLMAAAGIGRVVAVHLHAPAIEGFFAVPIEHLAAAPLLIEALDEATDDNYVVVAPDLGAARLADGFGVALGLPVAMVHKTRVSGAEVTATGITGDVRGRRPIVVDDMVTTGGTVVAAIEAVLAAGALPEVTLVATHGLFVGAAARRLSALPIRQIIVTDSVPLQRETFAVPPVVVSLGPLLADAIERLHSQRSLSDLLRET